MKAQCEKCAQTVELTFTPAAGGMDVVCSACKARYFVPATPADPEPTTSPAPVQKPAAAPEPASPSTPTGDRMTCPKCAAEQPRADACRACGLVQSRWKGAPAASAAAPATPDETREATALWFACEAGWTDPARHDAFLAHCQRTAAFALAALRYRAALAKEPTDAIAAANLKRVRTMAELALLRAPRPPGAAASTDDPSATPYKGTLLVLTLVILVLVGGFLYAMTSGKLGPHAEGPGGSAVPAAAPPPGAAPSSPPSVPANGGK